MQTETMFSVVRGASQIHFSPNRFICMGSGGESGNDLSGNKFHIYSDDFLCAGFGDGACGLPFHAKVFAAQLFTAKAS